jgi:hypothetical protein
VSLTVSEQDLVDSWKLLKLFMCMMKKADIPFCHLSVLINFLETQYNVKDSDPILRCPDDFLVCKSVHVEDPADGCSVIAQEFSWGPLCITDDTFESIINREAVFEVYLPWLQEFGIRIKEDVLSWQDIYQSTRVLQNGEQCHGR